MFVEGAGHRRTGDEAGCVFIIFTERAPLLWVLFDDANLLRFFIKREQT